MTSKSKHRVLKRRLGRSERRMNHRESRRQARAMKARVAGGEVMPQLFTLPPGQFPCPRTDDRHEWFRIIGHPAAKTTVVCGQCCVVVHVRNVGITVIQPTWVAA